MSVEIVKAKPEAPSKFLIIGEPFSGKTTLAAKAPDPLFMSTDGNAAKAGLTAVNVKSVEDIRETITLFVKSKEYQTLVIDTIEGVVDLFTKKVIDEHNAEGYRTQSGQVIQALTDVPYGKATGVFNSRVQAFANTLASLDKNVIVLSYIKRQVSDVDSSIILASEFKNIRFITRFMDAQILTNFDGEKHKANIIHKRELMAGKVEYGPIEPFLQAVGWELPKKKVKVGKGR